ncbi:hypothetical protein L1281_002346 [Neisseria sp. HSC-16F19]|nr:hypothetical protein [Neisseria sp. HSC-16F19]MCP2041732.1 hypothetical protein [Neisseria sp. HSC-16F19]
MKKIHGFAGLLAVFAATSALAEIHIAERIPYQDESRVDNRIVSECTEIGRIMSESVAQNGKARKLDIVRDGAQSGDYVNITIEGVLSAGNAFIGHAKGMSIYAEYYRDNALVEKTTFNRGSSGGAFGVFKNSCSVLYRTANVLGRDVAGWLAKKEAGQVQ